MADEKIEIDSQDASAGRPLGVMRYVLGISMVILIAIFAFLVIHGV